MQARIQIALQKIACEVPRRMLGVEQHLDHLTRRLAHCQDPHDAEVMAIVEALSSYRLWTEHPGEDLSLDAARLEQTALRLVDGCTTLEERLNRLATYCRQEKH